MVADLALIASLVLATDSIADIAARACRNERTEGGVRMCRIPTELPPDVQERLRQREAALHRRLDEMDAARDQINSRCGGGVTDPTTIERCRRDAREYGTAASEIEIGKINFNDEVIAAIRAHHARRPRRPPPAPPPATAGEAARLRDNPTEWLSERREAVREAVRRNRAWTDRITHLLEAPQPPGRRYEMTSLSDLSAGDILLVAPPNEQIDPSVATSNELIREVDYRYRVIIELAQGRLLDAATQERQPASHALTFLGSIHGVRMYLSEQPGGSRILDERAFLREYGARQMYVARPQAVVDGKRLWSAARNTAIRNPRDYGLFGDRAVCSERAGIVVARATGLNLDPDRPGPVDITPGDFFDAQGNVGKHFVITGLRITGVPQER